MLEPFPFLPLGPSKTKPRCPYRSPSRSLGSALRQGLGSAPRPSAQCQSSRKAAPRAPDTIRFGASLRLGQALLKPERFGSEPSVRRVYRGVPGACVRPLLGCCHLGGVREVSRALLSSQQQHAPGQLVCCLRGLSHAGRRNSGAVR